MLLRYGPKGSFSASRGGGDLCRVGVGARPSAAVRGRRLLDEVYERVLLQVLHLCVYIVAKTKNVLGSSTYSVLCSVKKRRICGCLNLPSPERSTLIGSVALEQIKRPQN